MVNYLSDSVSIVDVGMFGSSSTESNGAFMGDQVRGFGCLHDGAIDTLDTFFRDPAFN